MKTHELKIWPNFWDSINLGVKTFELRFDDRGFQVGDILSLTDPYGRNLRVKVSYIFRGAEWGDCGLDPGYVIMAIWRIQS